LTPNGADTAAVAQLSDYWQALGAKVEEMDPDHHDLVLAVTSHAPHLIAYTMVGVADDLHRVTTLPALPPVIRPCGAMCF